MNKKISILFLLSIVIVFSGCSRVNYRTAFGEGSITSSKNVKLSIESDSLQVSFFDNYPTFTLVQVSEKELKNLPLNENFNKRVNQLDERLTSDVGGLPFENLKINTPKKSHSLLEKSKKKTKTVKQKFREGLLLALGALVANQLGWWIVNAVSDHYTVAGFFQSMFGFFIIFIGFMLLLLILLNFIFY